MSWSIPNLASAAFADQAQLDSVDLEALRAGIRGNGVTTGCAVTSTGTGNGSVAVAAGQIRINDQLYTTSAVATLAIGANATGNTRYDLITAPSTGTPVVTAGTAAASPVFPAIPASSVVLAVVRVPNGHTTGTTIPANTIIDKRVDVPATMAGPTDLSAYYSIISPADNKPALRVYGGVPDGGGESFQLQEWMDYLGAPIAWLNTAGGYFINDYMRTSYTVFGPDNWIADIYGFVWQGSRASFAFGGPPGNMLSWANAVHENYNADRAATVANWSVVAGCTLSTVDLGVPPNSPTRCRTALRMTNSAGATNWISQPGGAFALSGVTAGRPCSAVAWVRSGTAAAGRVANVRLSFYNGAGVQQGSDVNSPNVTVPNTGVWTKLAIDGTTVPATATLAQVHVLVTTPATGETHDVCGVGIMKNSQTGVFGPPFVAQDATTGGASPGAEGVALVGARWSRTDTPTIPGNREYICQVGGAANVQEWAAVDTSTLYRLDADVSSTSTTAAAVAPFAIPVAANASLACDYDLFITVPNVATTGWALGFTGPASPTYFFAVCEYQSSATAWTTQTIQSLTVFGTVTAGGYVATPSIIRIRIKAQLVNGTNAGTLNLTWASETAASAVVIKKGSTLNVT